MLDISNCKCWLHHRRHPLIVSDDGYSGVQPTAPQTPGFFAFMLVMVMVLLNMLVAILMEAYGVVKEDAKNADSLFLDDFVMCAF